MRIGVLSLNQSAYNSPDRYISRSDARKYIQQGTHEQVTKRLIREIIAQATPSSSPERYIIQRAQGVIKSVRITVPQLKPPQPSSTLVLFYPVTDHSSFGSRNFNETWGCNQDEWRRRLGAS